MMAGLVFDTRHPFQAGARYGTFMAGPMQPSSSEPVAISNPLSGTSSSVLSSPPEPISFLKQSTSKPESNLSSIASAGLRTSPSPGLSSRSRHLSPQMTTTAAAPGSPADRQPLEQGKEPEQSGSQVAREALGAAMAASGEKSQETSTPPHAPTTTGSEPIDTVAKSSTIHMPSDDMQVDAQTDAFGTGDNAANTTTLINSSTVASPGPIEDTGSQDGDRPRHRDDAEAPPGEATNKSFSYPMPTAGGMNNDPRRGLSLPHSGFNRSSPRSPSAKKHRCPYCATEFTRHHNLKSHLLTHSQEKPYVCQTCQSRFRRLHDLKRHTKLHTGERPHICPKCGRRFARGDALARHNKGQGGCAGRRASMGSYGGEDEYGDGPPAGAEDGMDGLIYAEPERMDEEDERRLSMPSIKKHDAPSEPIPRSSASATYQHRQHSTYPPITANRPSPGGLFPPPTSHGGSSSSTSPISQTGNMAFPPPGQHSSTVFPPTSITESPKPLSPNALSSHQLGHGPEGNLHLHRAHSPNLTQQYQQQQHFSRTGPAPPPSTTASHSTSGQGPLGLPPPQPGAPQLPPPPGLNPPDARFALHGQGPVQPPSSAMPPKHTPSHNHSSNHSTPLPPKTGPETSQNSGNSHYPGSHDANGADQSREDKLWAYIRSVHEEVAGLQAEVAALRAQIAANSGASMANSSSGTTQQQQQQGEAGGGNSGQR